MHATVVVVVVVLVLVTVTGFVMKRLFASVATVCLEVGPSAAPSFLPGVLHDLHRHSQLPRKYSKQKFRSSPEVGDASSKSSCRHFSLPWCTPYVNVKLSGACAELKITYQLYGLSIRNPVRKVRIAERQESQAPPGMHGSSRRLHTIYRLHGWRYTP